MTKQIKGERNPFASFCLSLWDGCICELDRGHKNLHQCPGPHRDGPDLVTWNDAQATEFAEQVRTKKP